MQVNAVNTVTELSSPIRQTEKIADAKPKAEKQEIKVKVDNEEKELQEENLQKLKDVFAESNISLKYTRDDKTKALVVEMVDSKTGEAVLQIPSEVSLKLAALFIKTQGQFVDENK
ncbi:MAG TPA: flagellar protein FlaG [Pyrinomonadaceae bacterium]|nr:flagellar protein FlaG [Pyrinomonadaceae bacterium]